MYKAKKHQEKQLVGGGGKMREGYLTFSWEMCCTMTPNDS